MQLCVRACSCTCARSDDKAVQREAAVERGQAPALRVKSRRSASALAYARERERERESRRRQMHINPRISTHEHSRPLPYMTTNPRIPAFFGVRRRAKSGITKAPVLPDPVGAHARRSRPSIITGTACIWMGVGSFHPARVAWHSSRSRETHA